MLFFFINKKFHYPFNALHVKKRALNVVILPFHALERNKTGNNYNEFSSAIGMLSNYYINNNQQQPDSNN